MNEWINEWMKWMNQWMNGWMNKKMTCWSFIFLICVVSFPGSFYRLWLHCRLVLADFKLLTELLFTSQQTSLSLSHFLLTLRSFLFSHTILNYFKSQTLFFFHLTKHNSKRQQYFSCNHWGNSFLILLQYFVLV